VRDVELYRRPPVVTGDEPTVLRYTRGFRRKRRAIQFGFVGGVAAIGLLAGLTTSLSPLAGIVDFAALSSAFVVLHLASGRRIWMKPMEAYHDGLAGSEITFLFCRRRFVAWKEFESLDMAPGESPQVLRAHFRGGRTLESVPGEFGPDALEKMQGLMATAKEEAERARVIFESFGKEPAKNG
jgi:hypothetical protein